VIAVVGAGAFGTALAVVEARAGRHVVLWGRGAPPPGARRRASPALISPRRRPHLPPPGPRGRGGDPAGAPCPGHRPLSRGERGRASRLAARPVRQGPRRALLRPSIANRRRRAAGASARRPHGPWLRRRDRPRPPHRPHARCADGALGRRLQAGLATPRLRLYLTDDLVGAQLGGALKNVVAWPAAWPRARAWGTRRARP
jgi:glycerol-3-phosphate dehydrogenase (NAD(P)+)